MKRYEVLHDDDIVAVDASPLDARVADPLTGQAMTLELLIAVRPYSLSVPTVRLTTPTAKAVDFSMLVADLMQGRRDLPTRVERYVGVPSMLILDDRKLAVQKQRKKKDDDPGFRYPPNSIITDHAWIYLSHATHELLELLGTSLQLAREMTPTDKAHVEAAFRAISTGFSEHLAAFKGRNVEMRGLNVDGEPLLTPLEVERLMFQWLDNEWHSQPHGRPNPEIGARLTPDQLLALSVAQTGSLRLPTLPDLDKQLLPVRWAPISDRGAVEIDRVHYSGEILRRLRFTKSPHRDYEPARNNRASRKTGFWPFRIDDRDTSKIWLQDPESPFAWHRLDQPLSRYPDLPFGKEMNVAAQKEARDQNAHATPKQIQAKRDEFVLAVHSAESAMVAERIALRTRHQTAEARRDHHRGQRSAPAPRGERALDADLLERIRPFSGLPPLPLATYEAFGFDGDDGDLVQALLDEL